MPQYKVKTIRIPNLDKNRTIDDQEELIEDEINDMYENDYQLVSSCGGDCFILLIFKKIT